MQKELIVCVTGAGGRVAYSLIPQILKGAVFPNTLIRLRMLGTTQGLGTLKGLALEIEDSAYPLSLSVEYSDKPEAMFRDADVVIFLSGLIYKPGMERKDELPLTEKIFKAQAQFLGLAKPNVKCLVVSNPTNTNAKILAHYSKINPANITCLSRLDHNRALNQIALKTGARIHEVQGVYVFGNHSPTQYPCINNIKISGRPIHEVIEKQWLENIYISNVQRRGLEVIKAKGSTSVLSAANAIVHHLRDWYEGTNGRVVSMGVMSQGDYGIPKGLWSSLPVTCANFQYTIVKDAELSQLCKQRIRQTVADLEEQIRKVELN